MVGDGGAWLRRQAYLLAREGAAPIAWWLSMPLTEFVEWIEARNKIAKEEHDRAEEIRKERERRRKRR